jgi:hypothetical protein
MNRIKLCAYVVGGMGLVYAHGVAAQEGDSCEKRANLLRELFEGKYLELDEKCVQTGPCYAPPAQEPSGVQPSDSPDVASPSPIEGGDNSSEDDSSGSGKVGICGFPDSPECTASYEALASEVTAAWDGLYAECPDLATPVPVDGTGNSDSGEYTAVDTEPVFRAPTSAELFQRLKTVEKKLRRAKKVAKRERARARRCQAPRAS